MKIVLILTLAALLAGAAAAQQLEVNDPAGSLTSLGVSPVPGSPFEVGAFDSMNVTVEGNANAPFILIVGDLAATSTPVSMGGEFFDLDLNAPLFVLVDGFSLSAPLTNALGIAFLNPLGSATLDFPLSLAVNNATIAFQAITGDPGSPFGLNFTAAVEFDVVLAVTGLELDSAAIIPLPTPFSFYGQTVTTMSVTDKGYIDFDGVGAIDFSPSDAEFIAGAPTDGVSMVASPSSPMIAVYWNDLDSTGGGVVVRSTATSYTVEWRNTAIFFGPPVGSFSCEIDFSGGLTIAIDHGNLLPTTETSGLVGVSSGNAPVTTVTPWDLVSGTALNIFVPLDANKQTIFQHFASSPVVETVDTQGFTFTFFDTSTGGSAGLFSMF